MHTPTSLSRALSRSKHVKGVPPAGVVSGGVACLSGGDMQRLRLRVLDPVLLTCGVRTCVVVAWPLSTVPDAFVALDDASLASLGVVAAELQRNFTATPAKSKRARRKVGVPKEFSDSRESPKTARDRHRKPRESRVTTPASPDSQLDSPRAFPEGRAVRDAPVGNEVTEPKKLINIHPLPRGKDIVEATSVDVCPDGEFLWSEEGVAMVHSVLIGRILSPGMLIPVSMLGKHVRLVVKTVQHSPILGSACAEISNEATDAPPAKYASSSRLRILPQDISPSGIDFSRPKLADSIGGLDAQLKEVAELADAAFREQLHTSSDKRGQGSGHLWHSQKCRGVLLHGPPGTGKTLLACAISEVCNVDAEVICGPEVLSTFSGDAIRTVEASFSRARRKRPCIVVLDEVDAMTPKRDATQVDNVQRKLTAALLTILDGNSSDLEGLFVIGTTNRPDSIDAAVRRAGRFDREIEVTVPDPRERLQILQVLSRKAARENTLDVKIEELSKVARICYGFVGADLSALWRESVTLALRRSTSARVCYTDMLSALKLVRPSALREVAVEIPSTRWEDIGGMEDAKQRMKEAVEWPLTERGSALFASLGVTPPSGILLFGPPGCSKTLLARAVATESGANFISIKGAELLSKWVGESEKAVRAIFRRARQAAPCVIFFDEVDALAGSRSGTRGASAQARVVAQLLSEMDGIDTSTDEPNRRVVVIAATNRPDCLDEAFLRPGRIDVQIYVGLPDEEERLSIFRVHTKVTPLGTDVDLACIAADAVTAGFSGAEIGALVREAALSAMESDVENASIVCKSDFDQALRRVKPRTPASVVEYFADYVKQVELRKVC